MCNDRVFNPNLFCRDLEDAITKYTNMVNQLERDNALLKRKQEILQQTIHVREQQCERLRTFTAGSLQLSPTASVQAPTISVLSGSSVSLTSSCGNVCAQQTASTVSGSSLEQTHTSCATSPLLSSANTAFGTSEEVDDADFEINALIQVLHESPYPSNQVPPDVFQTATFAEELQQGGFAFGGRDISFLFTNNPLNMDLKQQSLAPSAAVNMSELQLIDTYKKVSLYTCKSSVMFILIRLP